MKNVVLPKGFQYENPDFDLILQEGNTHLRSNLINFLSNVGRKIRKIPLEERVKIISQASDGLYFQPDPTIPYDSAMQYSLFKALVDAITPSKLMQALIFSTDYVGAPNPNKLFVEGSNLIYPHIGVFVQPRNADVFTEWVVSLVAGLPVLVKGGPMSIALVQALNDTPLGEALAVLDWKSETSGDEFYRLLHPNSVATINGDVEGVYSVRKMLPRTVNVIERSHRRSIGVWTDSEDSLAYANAIGFLNGNACLTPSIGFSIDPLEHMTSAFQALTYFSQNYPLNMSSDDSLNIGRLTEIHKLIAKSKMDPNVGVVMGLLNGNTLVNPQGYRGLTLMSMRHSFNQWIRTFVEMNEQLRILAIDGLGGTACGSGAHDGRIIREYETVINNYFEERFPYRWVQTLAGQNIPEELIYTFIMVGGRRIVTPDCIIPNHAIPVDSELPISIRKVGGHYTWDPHPPFFCIINNEKVVAVNTHMLKKPYRIPRY
jgi:hypothetical protein